MGSVFFLPNYEDKVTQGAILFIVGSVLYGIVSCHDLAEVIMYHKYNPESIERPKLDKLMDLTAIMYYLVGTLLYIIGSIFSFRLMAKQ